MTQSELFSTYVCERLTDGCDHRAVALFNAVKKQFGLHTYLLRLEMPPNPPSPVPVPSRLPRLPAPPSDVPLLQSLASSEPLSPMPQENGNEALNTIRMSERDIQDTARFVREFVTMSLVPWMEKCVLDWNEAVSNMFLIS